MPDIEIFDISPASHWPAGKQKMWQHLQLLTQRILEKGADITSNYGADYFTIRYIYALFSDLPEANKLFHSVCQLCPEYDYNSCQDDYVNASKKTKFKSLRKLQDVCKFYDIDTTFEDEQTPSSAAKEYLPEGADETLFDTYGFFEKGHQYFTLESSGKNGLWIPKPFTNFTMRVLYHMHNGMQPRRVIEVVNDKNKKKVVDIPTDRLVSKNEFKKFLEGLGNYRFFGTDGKLDMLKAYLYDQENECHEINVLGMHDDGFWAWSNGVFIKKFHSCDDNGFVELNDKFYYLPSGNIQQPNRARRFSNELRFKHFQDQKTTFEDFAKMYCAVFPENGTIILTFTVACLFSDIVFAQKGFFPLLFVYGEGGSGKGSAIKMAQRLFGVPQDPLTLSGKANTDKSKIAVFAQFINAMLLLEEYVNNSDIDQLLKNLWDRYGYKRRTMDMGYGTETVPIQSGVAITGNFSPNDDPLLQRLIYLEHNKNQFDDNQRRLFNQFKLFTEAGTTSATHQLLLKRDLVQSRYRDVHAATFKSINHHFSGIHVTDRMVENITVVISIYTILTDAGVVFPFNKDVLVANLVATTKMQNLKRDSGGEVQKFFDVMGHLVSIGILEEDVHFRLDGELIYFNLKTLHPYYMEWHRKLHSTPGIGWGGMKDKMKVHPGFEKSVDTYRIGESRTSAFSFKINQTGIDILAAVNTQKTHRQKRNPMQQTLEEKMGGFKSVKTDDDELPFK